jgi:hypothetical protein
MGRKQFSFTQFPVYFAFTPGPIDELASEVLMLRRSGDAPEPYLWCVIQFQNYRFQIFVPGCPADEFWSRKNCDQKLRLEHFPSRFGPDWPFGPTQFSWGDWSGHEPVKTSVKVSFHVSQVVGVTRPSQEGSS